MTSTMISIRLPSEAHLRALQAAAQRHSTTVSAVARRGMALALHELEHQSATSASTTQEALDGDQDQTDRR